MVKFGKELMTSQLAKTLKEVIPKLIPPKGVKRKGNVEGIDLLGCQDKDMTLEEFEQKCNNEVCNMRK